MLKVEELVQECREATHKKFVAYVGEKEYLTIEEYIKKEASRGNHELRLCVSKWSEEKRVKVVWYLRRLGFGFTGSNENYIDFYLNVFK